MNPVAYYSLLAALMFGVNTVLWSGVGAVRWFRHELWPVGAHSSTRTDRRCLAPRLSRVAVLMAAHNEESVIGDAIASVTRLIPPEQVFVASDGSRDATVELVRAAGANVLDLQPNRGKAGALAAGVSEFGLADRFEVVLILDADTELNPDYFTSGLELFSDPDVAVVAGRATTQWRPGTLGLLGKVVVAHRERIYVIVQRLVKYGQALSAMDAVAIAPGFASMYRSRVLREVDMNPPGLVIEDFNMTFEIHRRRLGRIAFHPSAAVARTQDPGNLHEYMRQVQRWALGFWQTVRLHGLLHRGTFWFSLTLYCGELVLSALTLLATALLAVLAAAFALLGFVGVDVALPGVIPPVWVLVLVVLIPDLALTCAVAAGQRRAVILAAAPAYPLLRVVDAWLCLRSLVMSFRTTSSGSWSSPTRRTAALPAANTDLTTVGGTP
jgi:cellulose synthase/poly-beta-1,6-N-acetylglucosamine synthase-like glycosyltransferase